MAVSQEHKIIAGYQVSHGERKIRTISIRSHLNTMSTFALGTKSGNLNERANLILFNEIRLGNKPLDSVFLSN